MFKCSLDYSYSQPIAERHSLCITGDHLRGWIKHTNSEWCNIVSMEYRANNGKYHGQPELHHNVFCYWNKFKRVFENNFSYGFCGVICYCYCSCFTGIDLCWRIKYAYGKRRNLLSMEHRSNNSKYYGESKVDNGLFRYRN